MNHSVGMLLIAAVAGYWLLERSIKQRGRMKPFGKLLSAFIITVSLIGVICQLTCVTSYGKFGNCRIGKGKTGWSCPLAHKQAAPASSLPQ